MIRCFTDDDSDDLDGSIYKKSQVFIGHLSSISTDVNYESFE